MANLITRVIVWLCARVISVGLWLAGVAVVCAVTSPSASANATIFVGQHGCTLTSAVKAAEAGKATGGCAKGDTHGLNTILVPAGNYSFPTPAFIGQTDLDVSSGRIAIVGHRAKDTLIIGNGDSQIMKIEAAAQVTLKRLTLEYGVTAGGGVGGDGSDGGAVFNAGRLTIADSVLTENEASYGGNGADCAPPNCIAQDGGRAGNGGAVASTGTLTIIASTFSHNLTGAGGTGGSVTPGSNTSIAGRGGSGGSGGAVAIESGRATITRSTFSDNTTGGGGNGGANSAGITGNGGSGGAGGAISTPGNLAEVTISASKIAGNRTGPGGYGESFGGDGGDGGAISNYSYTGTLTVSSTRITGNATGNGGPSATFQGNGGPGGGVFTASGLTLRNDTLWANATGTGLSAAGGGGLETFADAKTRVQVVNSTIANNTTADGIGAGIQIGFGNLSLDASTVAGNHQAGTPTAGSGIDISYKNETLSERNSLVASNGAANCTIYSGATLTSLGHNLSYPDQSCGHQVTGNPKLGLLGPHGGLTPTMALATGSAALNRVPPGSGCLATDQRGIPRPQGLACDIGAYERIAAPDTKITSANINPAKGKATFSFKAIGGASGFQCALIRPGKTRQRPFSKCSSPTAYDHLGAGHYTFEVRAVSVLADPTPAERPFSIS